MSIELNRLLGDREAFGEIVRQYQNLVSAVTYSITGNRQESEDLAQETFITAWKNLPELREVEKLPAWLCGIARNLANNWIRRTQLERQNRCESALEAIPAAVAIDESDTESEREERIALLWATLKDIPLQFREPLVMYYQQNQSVVEIASALEISEANVRQRIARGRKYLKTEVERHVEKTLTFIRPSEHFTVAVLAALPIALTGEHVLAAGAAGATSVQSASSGGARVGASLFAGLSQFFFVLFCVLSAVYAWLLVNSGIVVGMWSGIRNAPTLRARQWMVKVTLGYIIAISLFAMVLLFLMGLPSRENFLGRVTLFLVLFLPVFILVASYCINRQWRKLSDTASEPQPGGREPQSSDCGSDSKNFLRFVYIGVFLAILFTFLCCICPIAMHCCYRALPWYPLFPVSCLFFGIIIPAIILPFFYYAVRISKDQEVFEKYPPRLPNLLAILTGEEKAPRGFRNRINFWGDLVGIGWGLYVLVTMTFTFYFTRANIEKAWHIDGLIVLLALLPYFLFAIYFAGIPRRRYWGMIFLGVYMLLLNFGVWATTVSSALLVKRTGDDWFILYVLSSWYLLCFTLLGAAGLWVFRKR